MKIAIPDEAPSWWPKPPTRGRGTSATVAVGRWLGLAFAVCLLTGVFSHLHQHPTSWFPLPTRPVWLYRVTQGLHVATGLAAIPLLLVKLWTVYPKLFAWPPPKKISEVLEKLSIGVLVSGSVFQLSTGLLNTLQWYPWPFGFVQAHWWVAWMTIGALLLHIAVKAPLIVDHWRRPRPAAPASRDDAESEPESGSEPVPDYSRRVLLGAAGVGALAVTVLTAGQSVPWLTRVSLLAPRLSTSGAGSLPINRTAEAAGVTSLVEDPAWTLTIDGAQPLVLTLAQLQAMPQLSADLPIACVEGWSANAHWSGVQLRALLELAGIQRSQTLRSVSLEPSGGNRVSLIPANVAWDPLTLLALQLEGQPLPLDHGKPCRLIAPGRPGVSQTKWLTRIEKAEL